MTNLEKFEDEIKLIVYSGEQFAIREHDGEIVGCSGVICRNCKFHAENTSCSRQRTKWMQEEYEKPTPKVDWSKVSIDTPIFVRASEDFDWIKRYFAGYMGGKVCAFNNGRTSEDFGAITPWDYAKLAKQEKKQMRKTDSQRMTYKNIKSCKRKSLYYDLEICPYRENWIFGHLDNSDDFLILAGFIYLSFWY